MPAKSPGADRHVWVDWREAAAPGRYAGQRKLKPANEIDAHLPFDAGWSDGPATFTSTGIPAAEVAEQVHLPCIRFVFRSSLHLSHCDTGLPFFFTSNSGRSVC